MPVRYTLSQRGRRLGKAAISAASSYAVSYGQRKLTKAIKRRNPKSRSRPKKQRRRPAPSSSGGQSSVCKYISPMSKYTRTALAGCQVQTLQDDLATLFHSGIGQQSATVWANFGTVGTLNRVKSHYASNFAITVNVPIMQRFHLVSEIHDSSWSNPGTMPLDITFYSIYHRKDSSYDCVNAWNDGQIQEGDTVNPISPASNYRSTPHRSRLFMEHFKIANVKRVTLQPGEIHKRKTVWMKPRGIDDQQFEQGASTNTFMGKYSMTEMVVLHGYPAPLNNGTTTNPISSSSEATISPATVCLAVRRTLGYKFSVPNIKIFTAANSLVKTGTVTNETELVLKTESDE